MIKGGEYACALIMPAPHLQVWLGDTCGDLTVKRRIRLGKIREKARTLEGY